MELKQQARNAWTGFLESQGIGAAHLTRKHGPCPMCGGKDRFRYINKQGDGTFVCNTCTPKGGSGFDLLMKFRNLEFSECCRLLEKYLGIVPGYEPPKEMPVRKLDPESKLTEAEKEEDGKRKERYLKEAWEGAQDITEGDPVYTYLTKTRGLKLWDLPLAFHKGLYYKGTDDQKYVFPAMLALVTRGDGLNVTIHRTYLTVHGKKIDYEKYGDARKMMSGRYSPKGAAIRLGEPVDGVLGIAEGIETAIFCMQESGVPCWSVMSHVFMPMVVIPEHVHTVYIFGDCDGKDPKTGKRVGQESAKELAVRLVTEGKTVYLVIPLDDDTDWLDHGYLPDMDKLKPFKHVDGWGEPIKLKEDIELPEFHESLLPDAFQAYVMDLTETLQCPIEFPAVSIMVAASTVIGAGCEVRPKLKSNWSVVPNLWGLLVGYAGSMKTPALVASNSILKRFEKMTAELYKEEEKIYKKSFSKYEVKMRALQDKLKKLVGGKGNNKDDILIVEGEIDALTEPEKPIWRRYLTNDATVEKIQRMLAENHRGLLFFKDEIAGLFKTWEKPGRESDRQYFMESWTGSNPKTTDRVGGGTIFCPNHCLSLIGSTQPHVLRDQLAQSILNSDDGLFQRFQLTVYPKGRQMRWVDDDEDTVAKEKVHEVLHRLATVDLREYGATVESEGKRPFFRFDEQAYKLYQKYFLELTAKTEAMGKEEHYLSEHLIKYKSLVPSIALIIHLADCAAHSTSGPVTAIAVDKAIQWAEILEAHARKVYAMLAGYKKTAMLKLGAHIKDGDLGDSFTITQVLKKDWGGLTNKKVVEECLEMLADDNWIENRGPRWEVNPLLKEKETCKI